LCPAIWCRSFSIRTACALAVIGYTSFNDGATESAIKRDTVRKALGHTNDVTDDELRAYLTETGKYTPEIIASVTITGQADHREGGLHIVYSHAPLEKFRLVFPLDAPVEPLKLESDQRESLATFAAKVRGLGQLIGVIMDESCTDPSRAFYLPSHRKDAEFGLDIVRGRPLTFEELPTVEKAGKKVVAVSTITPDRKRWAAKYAKRLELARLLETECPDKVRTTKGDLVVIECPFDEMHSNAGAADDTACHAENADGDRGFVFRCKHDSCVGHDRLDMIEKALADGWFEESALTDDNYLIPLSDEELAEQAAKTAPPAVDESLFEPVKDWLPAGYVVKHGVIYLADEEGDVPICQFFNVIGKSSNMGGDGEAGRTISFRNGNGEEVEMTLDRADMFRENGGTIIDDLARAEMVLFIDGRAGRDRLLSLLRRITPKRRIPTSVRPGWLRDRTGKVTGYLCATGEYINACGTPVRLHSDVLIKDRQPMGTLQGYKDACNAAHAAGNFYWDIGIAGGFAGPVLDLIGMTPCGIALTGKTSMGKTVASRLAVAAGSNPHDASGLMFTMNSTTNAFEDLATKANGGTLALDEISAMQNVRDLPAALFSLSTGAGKARKAGRGAGLADTAEFNTFVFLTNERSLRTVIESVGGVYKDGLSVRFPNVAVTDGLKVSAAEMAEIEGFATNFGHALPAFVRWLIAEGHHNDPKTLIKRHEALTDKIAGTPRNLSEVQSCPSLRSVTPPTTPKGPRTLRASLRCCIRMKQSSRSAGAARFLSK
ncbi:MAG: DUF927 domain-containing protein, partial [Cypionkella sp.]